MFVPDVLNVGLLRTPDAPAVSSGDRGFSYRELDERSNRVVSLLLTAGVEAGDRIALLAKNEIEFFELQIGVQRCGAIFVPLNYRLSRPEIRYILDDCAPSILFAGPDHEEDAEALFDRVMALRPGGADYLAGIDPAERVAMLPASALAQILYTSGTTGRPRGAMVSNSAFGARYTSYAIELRACPGDLFVQCLPAFHLAGTFCFSFLAVGASVDLIRKVEGGAILDLVERRGATCLHLVPTILQDLLDDPLKAAVASASLSRILCGGSASTQDLIIEGCRILDADCIHLYGLTEAGAATRHWISPSAAEPMPTSVGHDMIGFETRLADAEGRDADPGQSGEVMIRGAGSMMGYWNDPEGSAAVLRDGWISTGDGGCRDADGRLYITDRIKDMIITGGENVYSVEVEAVLLGHSSVAECAVVAMPDARLGERVHALVVLQDDAAEAIARLEAHCRDRLAGYKRPRSWTILPGLPRNAMGKVSKADLRTSLKNGELSLIPG